MASSALAQTPVPDLRGTWTATAGSQTLRGSWGAEVSRGTPDLAEGYWTLLDDSGERIMQGTWSARKTASRWHGSWTARTAQGRSFAGTWDADMAALKDETLSEMLKRTIEEEISGAWQSGRYRGNWWLEGLRRKSGTN